MSEETLIHRRVRMANEGINPTAIRKLPSGWLVLGDKQALKGYCLLLSDPVVLDLNHLDHISRAAFLSDMAMIGDALLEVTDAYLINYMVLGNLDHTLHAHIHPRYHNEPGEKLKTGPWAYRDQDVEFDPERDQELIDRIGSSIDRRLRGS